MSMAGSSRRAVELTFVQISMGPANAGTLSSDRLTATRDFTSTPFPPPRLFMPNSDWTSSLKYSSVRPSSLPPAAAPSCGPEWQNHALSSEGSVPRQNQRISAEQAAFMSGDSETYPSAAPRRPFEVLFGYS